MRVLFTTLPAYGSFQPLAPVARALIAAGHEVTFATAPGFCPVVERAGFRCLPAGFDWVSDGRNTVYSSILKSFGPRAAPVRDVFAGFMAPRMAPDLLDIARDTPFDLLVRDPLEFGGCVAAEALGCPMPPADHSSASGMARATPRRGRQRCSIWTSCARPMGCRQIPRSRCSTAISTLRACRRPFLGPKLTIPPTVRFIRPEPFDRLEAKRSPHGSTSFRGSRPSTPAWGRSTTAPRGSSRPFWPAFATSRSICCLPSGAIRIRAGLVRNRPMSGSSATCRTRSCCRAAMRSSPMAATVR